MCLAPSAGEVSASVAIATCSEQSGSSVCAKMARRPVAADLYAMIVPPGTVASPMRESGIELLMDVCAGT